MHMMIRLNMKETEGRQGRPNIMSDTPNSTTSPVNMRETPTRPWFAYVSADDALLDGVEVPQRVDRIRLTDMSDLPLFVLFYQQDLKMLTPIEVLDAFSAGRISFPSEWDRVMFTMTLTRYITEYQSMMEEVDSVLKKIKVVAVIAGVAVGACAIAKLLAYRK